MVALNRGASCRDAEPYYYDFQANPNNPAIPEPITSHIKGCTHCQSALQRLEGMLAESETGGATDRGRDDAGLIDALSLHFEYLDERVTCAQVKPFLPALSMPSEQIRIPTPITVHVDNCPQCAADLEAIRDLNLHAEQLARLSRLFGEGPRGNSAMCPRAQASIAALGSEPPAGIAAEIWDHLCVCPPCRALLYEHREAVLEKRQAAGPHAAVSACDGLHPADIFDCVIPFGLTAAETESATAAHVWACPACLEKVQVLHRTLFDIAERADSQTVTVYAAKDRGRRVRADKNDRYARYGIDVRVVEGAAEPGTRRLRPAARARTRPRRRILRPAIKPFVKVAALAAVIPLAILLFVQTRSASGTGPEEIANAFARAANVHVQLFHSSQTEPIQQRWVSWRPRVFMMTDGSGYALYDMRAKTKTLANVAPETTETTLLPEREYEGARSIMEGCLGITLAGIPVDHQWRQVTQDETEGIETYELTWNVADGGGRAYQAKWEVVIDAQTKRPRKTVLFRRYSAEGGWEYQSRREFGYPTEGEIRAAIAERFADGAAAPI
ncbi:MAG: hypothetical protein JW741_22715 [Sedimentisphaerales bacterium]|nr:hypothetical protein [Sedimentisphaerales bacterium]